MADQTDMSLLEEFEGHGGEEEEQISGYVHGLAQEVSQQLGNWMDGGALTDTMVEPMIDLLKQLFVDFERYYMQSLKVDELKEEKETLQKLLHDARKKYQVTVERHNSYVDQLEQEKREEKNTLHQLREKNADLVSRLENAKSSLEDIQAAYDDTKLKHKEESRKLYNAVEFYRSTSERKDRSLLRNRKLPSIKSRERPAIVDVSASLDTTSSGIPLVPGAFSPEPTEDSLSLLSSQRSSMTQQSDSQSEQTVAEPLNKEIEDAKKSQGAADTSEQTSPATSSQEHKPIVSDSQTSMEEEEMYTEDQTPNDDQLEVESEPSNTQEMTESSAEPGSSWVEVENTGREHVTVRKTRTQGPPPLSLAQEFELLAPEEFAQTEMQQMLNQRDEAVDETEKLKAAQKTMLVELDALKNQNMVLKKIVDECHAKEKTLSDELASVRREHEKALQESLHDDENLGAMFVFTKKEMFAKIKELMQLKNRCHYFEEDNRNLKKLLSEKKTPKQKSLLSSLFDKVFRRNTSSASLKPAAGMITSTPTRTSTYKRSVTPTLRSVQPLQGITLENFTWYQSWLLGYQASGVMPSLPNYIGRIPLKGLEIERIDYSAVARISKGLFTPDTSPARPSESTSVSSRPPKSFVGANMQGQCTAEVWVATAAETGSHVEVISVFSPSEKQVKNHFVTKCQHIRCMMAVPGNVPVSEEFRRRSRSSLSPPPAEISMVSDNKDPLRKNSTSPDGEPMEDLVMWIISEIDSKLYFHNIVKDCHRELNSVDLERLSYCMEYAGGSVFIGQSDGNLTIFKKSKDDSTIWNIENPFIFGISCPPDQLTHINCLKAIGDKLWIAAGELIYIMDPLQLGIEIIIDESEKDVAGTHISHIEQVQNVAVITFYRRSIIKIYESDSGNFIKEIDISSVCIILNKLPTSPCPTTAVASITSLASSSNTLYVGTKYGKMIAFSVKALCGEADEEDSPDGRRKRKKLKKLAQAAEQEKEEARIEYEKQLVEDINRCAISVYMHKISTRSVLCFPLPAPLQPNLPVVYDSLVVTVGKGYHHLNQDDASMPLRSESPIDRLSDHCQLLVWGIPRENRATVDK